MKSLVCFSCSCAACRRDAQAWLIWTALMWLLIGTGLGIGVAAHLMSSPAFRPVMQDDLQEPTSLVPGVKNTDLFAVAFGEVGNGIARTGEPSAMVSADLFLDVPALAVAALVDRAKYPAGLRIGQEAFAFAHDHLRGEVVGVGLGQGGSKGEHLNCAAGKLRDLHLLIAIVEPQDFPLHVDSIFEGRGGNSRPLRLERSMQSSWRLWLPSLTQCVVCVGSDQRRPFLSSESLHGSRRAILHVAGKWRQALTDILREFSAESISETRP